jgi:hypothetical protein
MTNGILPQQSQTAREMWSMFAGLIDQAAVSRFFDVPRRYWLAMGISDGPEHGTARGRSGNLARSCRKIPSRFLISRRFGGLFSRSLYRRRFQEAFYHFSIRCDGIDRGDRSKIG